MNRIRKHNGIYQVLMTNDLNNGYDSTVMMNKFSDYDISRFYIVDFTNMNDALYASLQLQDIDWEKVAINHSYIYKRLCNTIQEIIRTNKLQCNIVCEMLSGDQLKHVMFNRVMGLSNIIYENLSLITITIHANWTQQLETIIKYLETYTYHFKRDDLRLKTKKKIDDKIYVLYGQTELGTTYNIKLMPSLIYNFVENVKTNKETINANDTTMKYNELLKVQNIIDANALFK